MIDQEVLAAYVACVREQRAEQKLAELRIIEQRLEFERSINSNRPAKKIKFGLVP